MLKPEKSVFMLGHAELIEKKSRFLSTARPVHSEEEVEEICKALEKQYWDASHVVYAYRITPNNSPVPIEKASDAGEPARTAGFPILSILQREELSNILVTVVRYFGGTLLGTGGLVRAYSASAQLALQEAMVIEKKVYLCTEIHCDYTYLGKIQYILASRSYPILNTEYEEKITLTCLLPVSDKTILEKELSQISSGSIVPNYTQEVLAAPIEGNYEFFESVPL